MYRRDIPIFRARHIWMTSTDFWRIFYSRIELTLRIIEPGKTGTLMKPFDPMPFGCLLTQQPHSC